MSVIEDKARLSSKAPEGAASDASAGQPYFSQSRALVPVAQPLHRMHEGHVVRPAGRMLVGSHVPVPTLDDILNETPVFGGRGQRKSRISGGLVVLVTCVLAIGGAIGVTHYLSKNRRTSAEASPQTAQRLPAASVTTVPRLSGAQGEAEAGWTNFTVRDISGTSGAPLALTISVAHASPDEHAFLMIRGLPQGVTISEGFAMKDAWAVSLRDLNGLKLQAPTGYAGIFVLEVLLIKGKDQPAEARRFSVSIKNGDGGQMPKSSVSPDSTGSVQADEKRDGNENPETETSPAPRVTAVTPPSPPEPAIKAPARRVAPAEEAAMLAKANRLLENFDVAGARLLFEYLARRGSSKGALELAQTYDPVFFETTNIRGMRPDVDKAQKWYAAARDLGSEEAALRLRDLAQR